MSRKRRIIAHPVETKVVEASADAPVFEMFLSTSDLDLGNWLYRDKVHPGAFAKTLGDFHAASDPYVPLIDTHDDWSIFNVVGKMLDGEERTSGEQMKLWTKWEVLADDQGDRVMQRLRQGIIRKGSMGYVPVRFDFEEDEASGDLIRNLYEVKLVEGSLVTFPMNPEAEVIRESVKSLRGHVDDEAELDRMIAACHGGEICILDLRKSASALIRGKAVTPEDSEPTPDPEDGAASTEAERKAMEQRLADAGAKALDFVNYGR